MKIIEINTRKVLNVIATFFISFLIILCINFFGTYKSHNEAITLYFPHDIPNSQGNWIKDDINPKYAWYYISPIENNKNLYDSKNILYEYSYRIQGKADANYDKYLDKYPPIELNFIEKFEGYFFTSLYQFKYWLAIGIFILFLKFLTKRIKIKFV
jgi:hypothetical protein